jgi:hypothetical protein
LDWPISRPTTTPTTNHPPLKTIPYLIKKILFSIVFPELNAGNLQLPVGFRRVTPLVSIKKIFHYHYVLREEFPSDTYLGGWD